MNDKKIELTEAAIEAWRDDIDFRFWKERAIGLMRAGLPNARLTEDVARLTKERDEARAILADLQATNIAMQQDRDGLHQRIEELQADFDEAIQQRDQAQAQVESLKKRANVGALMRQVVDRTASAKWEARARVLAGMVHELIGGA